MPQQAPALPHLSRSTGHAAPMRSAEIAEVADLQSPSLHARAAEKPFTADRFGASPLRVLVTGATGFVGGHLVRALLAGGHQVIALSRKPAKVQAAFAGRVRGIASLDTLLPTDPVDMVVNLAGARIVGQRWSAARQAELLASRVGTTHALGDWIARTQVPPRLLLSGSAVGYYGAQPRGDDRLLDESAPAQPRFMSTLCQRWETAAHEAAARAPGHATAVHCMRFGMVLGKDGGALPPMLIPVRIGLGGRLGDGRQWLSWIHIADVVGAMAHLASATFSPSAATAATVAKNARPAAGVPPRAINFTAPHTVRQAEFMAIAAGVLHRPCWLPTPAWPVRAVLGEQADILLEGQRAVPQALLGLGYQFVFPELAGALTDLERK